MKTVIDVQLHPINYRSMHTRTFPSTCLCQCPHVENDGDISPTFLWGAVCVKT